MQRWTILAGILAITITANAQNNKLPVKALPAAKTGRPLICYISGDGGWTGFSENFMRSLNKSGYPVIALNARDYFWDKKTPEQTALDVSGLVKQYMNAWQCDSVVLIGYSFGADAMPFAYNHMDDALQHKVKQLVLMLPYTTTDLKIHLSEMLGFARKDGYSVINEINKLNIPVLFVLGTEKSQFPLNSIHTRNYRSLVIDGGHHFDDNAVLVANKVLMNLQ